MNSSTKYLLTGRQREIVDLRLKGYTSKQIAEQLGLTNYTVKQYIQHAYERLGVHSTDELYEKMLDLEAGTS